MSLFCSVQEVLCTLESTSLNFIAILCSGSMCDLHVFFICISVWEVCISKTLIPLLLLDCSHLPMEQCGNAFECECPRLCYGVCGMYICHHLGITICSCNHSYCGDTCYAVFSVAKLDQAFFSGGGWWHWYVDEAIEQSVAQ